MKVQEQLYDILEVHASSGAFAAVRADGAVITWGHPLSGGDSRPVRTKKPNATWAARKVQRHNEQFHGRFGEVMEADVKMDRLAVSLKEM